MTAGACILVVDDEQLIALALSETVKAMGHTTCGPAATGERAIELALEHAPRLVLMDVRLRGTMDGIEAAAVIRERVGCPIIFITGSSEVETIRRIEESRPAAVLIKPILPNHLTSAIDAALAG